MTRTVDSNDERRVVEERFIRALRDNRVLCGVDPDAVRGVDLIGTGKVDSLGMLKLLAILEDDFGISVEQGDVISRLRSVDDCIGYIVARSLERGTCH